MKRINFLTLALAAFALASCSSDDDDVIVNPAQEVTGSYKGYAVVSSTYFKNMVAPGETVTITETTSGKVAVKYVSTQWGTVEIPAATVGEKGNDYLLSGTGTSVMGMNGNSKEYACELNGTVTKGVADLTFSCPAVMGGLTINFMQGDIPADIVVPGTYEGYSKAVAQYFPQGMLSDDQALTITAEKDGTYTVNYTSSSFGTFTITGVTATSANGGEKFTLAGEGKTVMGMDESSAKEYACTFTGSVDAAKEAPEFTFKVPAVMGGLTISFITGEMPQE